MARERAHDKPAPEPADERAADPQTLSLGQLSGLLGYHIAQAAVTTVALYEHHVGQPFGLRKVEYSLLMLILANGPLAPKRLAQALALSAPNMSMLLDRLQERGLLRRERSQVDRRSQNVVLTSAGAQVARDSAAAAAPMEQALFDRLSPAEHGMLIELLRKVAQR
jgi:MarR family transcriptional regulator for hemolysin